MIQHKRFQFWFMVMWFFILGAMEWALIQFVLLQALAMQVVHEAQGQDVARLTEGSQWAVVVTFLFCYCIVFFLVAVIALDIKEGEK
jgi:uncharacterized membrane protein YhaH (DUF805 family)